VALIKVIPNVAEVLGESLLLELSKIVDCWIDQGNSHERKENFSMLECPVNVDFIDENTKDK